jgi:hypothetical protein
MSEVQDAKTQEFVEKSKQYFKESMNLTKITYYVGFLAGVLAAIITIITMISASITRKEPDTEDFATQLQRLNATEKSLKDLLEFVSSQRTKLKDAEKVLETLKEEHAKLRPVVEADRKVVEAVLQAQSDQQSVSVARERWIGAGMGVATSMFATFLCSVLVWVYRRYRPAVPPIPPPVVQPSESRTNG